MVPNDEQTPQTWTPREIINEKRLTFTFDLNAWALPLYICGERAIRQHYIPAYLIIRIGPFDMMWHGKV